MSYTTLSNLELVKPESELIQLTDGTSSPDTSKVNFAISKADRLIDGFLYGSVYGWVNGVGITPFPDLITDIATDLSIFYLYNIKYGENVTIYEEKGIYKRYQEAIKMLERIKKKEVCIGVTEATWPSIHVQEIDQVFTSDIMDGY